MNILRWLVVMALGFISVYAVDTRLSTHILDIAEGTSAHKVKVELYKMDAKQNWVKVSEDLTDMNGRINDLLSTYRTDHKVDGIYKLKFYTHEYYQKLKKQSFYPFIEVAFEVSGDQEHYHVPITISPFGYSTYRGS